jgi:hypothetical protein
VFDECYQRTIDCGGKILLTLTPLNDIDSGVRNPWVFDLYEDWRAGNKSYHFSQLSFLNSPFVSEYEKEQAKLKWAGDPEEGARLYGHFVRRGGLVYPTWGKSHIIQPFPIPSWWQRIVSIDPANTGVTAAVWIAVDELGNHFAYKEYYERERTISEHAKAIIMYCDEKIDYWLLDPYWGRQRNGETHKSGEQLYRESGIPVRLPRFDDDNYPIHVSREYINAASTPASRQPYFKIFAGQMPNFEHEITHYTWDTFGKGEQKGLSKEKPRKRNDHLMNAFQYALTLRLKGSKRRGSIFDMGERLSREDRVKIVSYT